MKVTEDGAKSAGTVGSSLVLVADDVGLVVVLAGVVGCWLGLNLGRLTVELATGLGEECSEDATRGSATTATTTKTAAAPAEAADITARRILRRWARFLIWLKVPGGGRSGSTCVCSHVSKGSSGSVTSDPPEAGL